MVPGKKDKPSDALAPAAKTPVEKEDEGASSARVTAQPFQ
jgi:hypothetical protein